MLELGVCTQAEHYRIGRIAAQKSDYVLAYGPNASRVVSGCFTGGMDAIHARDFADKEKLIAHLEHVLKPGCCVLVKGSRGMHMEQVVDALQKREN